MVPIKAEFASDEDEGGAEHLSARLDQPPDILPKRKAAVFEYR